MKSIIKYINLLFVFGVLFSSALLYSQDLPLIYNQGTSYVGPYEPSGPISVAQNTEPVVIEGKEFSGLASFAITLLGSKDITIKNCKFVNMEDFAIFSQRGINITVADCVFENVKGAFLGLEAISDVKFEHNDVKNIANKTDAFGVAFQAADGPGLTIRNNVFELLPGQGPEAVILTAGAKGTAESPILIQNNWIRGGRSIAIAIGNMGGAYQVIEDNRLVNTGMCGIFLLGGNDIIFRNNKIYSKSTPGTIAGMYFQTNDASNIIVENNEVNWILADGSFSIAIFNDYMKGILPNWEEISQRTPRIDETILPEVILGIIEPFDPNPPKVETPKISIYADSFNRVSVKIFKIPTPEAVVEIFNSTDQLIATVEASGFRTLVDRLLPPGEYVVKVTFPALEVSESLTIVIK